MNLRQRKIFHIHTHDDDNDKKKKKKENDDDKKRTVCGYGYYKSTLITFVTSATV